MRLAILFVLSSLLTCASMTSAEARPARFAHHHHNVVVKQVVVSPAPTYRVVNTYSNVRTALPAGFIRINREGKIYYYYDGIYYTKSVNGFIEARPLVGVKLVSLPRKYVSVRVGRETLYRVNDVYYRLENGFYIVV